MHRQINDTQFSDSVNVVKSSLCTFLRVYLFRAWRNKISAGVTAALVDLSSFRYSTGNETEICRQENYNKTHCNYDTEDHEFLKA